MSGVREHRFRENTDLLIVFNDKNGCHLSFSPVAALAAMPRAPTACLQANEGNPATLVHMPSASTPAGLLESPRGHGRGRSRAQTHPDPARELHEAGRARRRPAVAMVWAPVRGNRGGGGP